VVTRPLTQPYTLHTVLLKVARLSDLVLAGVAGVDVDAAVDKRHAVRAAEDVEAAATAGLDPPRAVTSFRADLNLTVLKKTAILVCTFGQV
jgi:hypothetical protein